MSLRDAREWLAETLDALASVLRQRPVEVPTPPRPQLELVPPVVECWNPGGPCPVPNDPDCDTCGPVRPLPPFEARAVAELVAPLCAACVMGAAAGHTCRRT